MKTRSSLKLDSYGIKALLGKKVIRKKKFYLVQWEDKNESNCYVAASMIFQWV